MEAGLRARRRHVDLQPGLQDYLRRVRTSCFCRGHVSDGKAERTRWTSRSHGTNDTRSSFVSFGQVLTETDAALTTKGQAHLQRRGRRRRAHSLLGGSRDAPGTRDGNAVSASRPASSWPQTAHGLSTWRRQDYLHRRHGRLGDDHHPRCERRGGPAEQRSPSRTASLMGHAELHRAAWNYRIVQRSTSTLTLSGTATRQQYEDVLHSVTYSSKGAVLSDRILKLSVTDDQGLESAQATTTIAVHGGVTILGGTGCTASAYSDSISGKLRPETTPSAASMATTRSMAGRENDSLSGGAGRRSSSAVPATTARGRHRKRYADGRFGE